MLSKLSGRYSEGYQVCRWLIIAGKAVGFIGLCLTAALWYGTYKALPTLAGFTTLTSWISANLHWSPSDQLFFLISAVVYLGAAIVLIFEVIGKVISAFGQTVRAVIDTAVNTSPLLSVEEKFTIMDNNPWARFMSKFLKSDR